MELLETLNAFICSESRPRWRLWSRKPSAAGMTQQPVCGWRVGAGFVLAGKAAVCPWLPPTGAEVTAAPAGCADLGWGCSHPRVPCSEQLPTVLLLLPGPMNGQLWVLCNPRRWRAGPACLDVSLPRAASPVLWKRFCHRVGSSCGFCCHYSHFNHLPILCFL